MSMPTFQGDVSMTLRPEYRQPMPDLLPCELERRSVTALPLAPDIRPADWNVLFAAVRTRLAAIVAERFTVRSLLSAPQRAERVRAGVMDCVAALDQLHGTLLNELSRSADLEQQVLELRAALTLARAQLIDTQDGERKARHQALHDGLTGLPNRRFFCERLDHALNHLAPEDTALAVLYLDLDEFKNINDQHGHAIGDELLRVVATRLNRVVRTEDMVSRMGGDEFACLRIGMLDRQQLSQLAGKLFDVVAAPLRIAMLSLQVRPSIGIAVHPRDGDGTAALLRNADAAMYVAKRQRSGHAFFEP
jgi:diguanylate cyclase